MSSRGSRINVADRIAKSRSQNNRGRKVLNMNDADADLFGDNKSTRRSPKSPRKSTKSAPERFDDRKNINTPARATPGRSTPVVVTLPISPVRRASSSRNSEPARSRSKRQSNNRKTASKSVPRESARKSRSKEDCGCDMNAVKSENTVQEILTKYGYTEIEQAMIKDDTVPICNFFFAINPKGTRVTIESDIKTSESNVQSCKYLRSQASPSRVSMGLKIGLFNAASPEVFGVVIACDNGICVMSRAENGFTDERSFSIGTEPVCGMQCVQPLVLLSDIMADANETLRLTETAAGILRRNMYNMSHNALKELRNQSVMLTKAIDMFMSNENQKTRQLGAASSELSKRLSALETQMQNSTVRDIDIANKNLLVANLTWRKDLADGLITSINSLNHMSAMFNKEIATINRSRQDLDEKFEGFEFIKEL